MNIYLLFGLILVPFLVALLLLLRFNWRADTVGLVTWVLITSLAIFVFQTDLVIALLASVGGILGSFPISLMVLTSIFMITYMQQTGALRRAIIFFKTLGGGGSRGFQLMFLNLGLGTFLVSIGATPISILPPIMIALGYAPLIAIALPAIGYDPLTTFALLSIPAVVFADIMGIPLQDAGIVFSWYMPVVTTGIAIAMLFIAGGWQEVKNKESLTYAIVSGIVAGGTCIVVNYIGLTTLTGVFAGLAVMIVTVLMTKMMGNQIVDNSILSEEEKEFAASFSLLKALGPWIILIVLCALVNIEPLYSLLFVELSLPINIGSKMAAGQSVPAIVVKTRVLWQAYLWVLVATVLSMTFLKRDRVTIRSTLNITRQRALRPVFAASIFFAVAAVLENSGTILQDGLWVGSSDTSIADANNMVFVLATLFQYFGIFYPLIVPFIGLFGGFVTGSETSSIAMFTRFHTETATLVGVDPVIVGAANGIGGGLASVLSPAKIANAAAVVDSAGIEGQIIRFTAPIAILLVWITAIMTFILTTSNLSAILLVIGGHILLLVAVIGFRRIFRNDQALE